MTKRKITTLAGTWIVAIVMLAAILLSGCAWHDSENGEVTVAPLETRGIRLTSESIEVTGELIGSIELTAELIPQDATGEMEWLLAWEDADRSDPIDNHLEVSPQTPSGNKALLRCIARYDGTAILTVRLKSNESIYAMARITAPIPVQASVIGFKGLLFNSTNELTWTDDIAEYTGYTTDVKSSSADASVVNVTITSPLDNYFPFNQISKTRDQYGNQFIRFPRFYMKWDAYAWSEETGEYIPMEEFDSETADEQTYILDGIKISDKKLSDEYVIPDCFLSPERDGTYMNYVYIGEYENLAESGKAISKPVQSNTEYAYESKSAEELRGLCRAYGTSENSYGGYQSMDGAIADMYQLLSMLYFKSRNLNDLFAKYGKTINDSGASGIIGVTAPAFTAKNGITLMPGTGGTGTQIVGVRMLGVVDLFLGSTMIDGMYYRVTATTSLNTKQLYQQSNGPLNYGVIDPNGADAKLKLTHRQPATVSNNKFFYSSLTVRKKEELKTALYYSGAGSASNLSESEAAGKGLYLSDSRTVATGIYPVSLSYTWNVSSRMGLKQYTALTGNNYASVRLCRYLT